MRIPLKTIFTSLISLLVGQACFAQDHYIPQARNLAKKSYELSFEFDAHTSSTRFDSDGNEQPFLKNQSFSQNQAQISGGFGWRKEIELRAGLKYRMVTSGVDDNNQALSLSNAGLESAFLGAQYAISQKYVKAHYLAFFGNYRQALYNNTEFDNSMPFSGVNLGDAQREITFGVNFFYKMKSKFKGFDIGLAYKSYELISDQLDYRLLGVYESGRVAISAGLIGKVSIEDNQALPQAYTASTFLFNSNKQSLLSAQIQVIYRISKRWRTSLGYERDFSGTSTDIGSRFLAGVSYRVESKYREKRRRETFKNYNIEAVIEKISSQRNYVIVDKGFIHGVQKGMVFDFFTYDFKGGNKLLARGVVAKTRSKQSAVKIVEWFSKSKKLSDDVIARGDINR